MTTSTSLHYPDLLTHFYPAPAWVLSSLAREEVEEHELTAALSPGDVFDIFSAGVRVRVLAAGVYECLPSHTLDLCSVMGTLVSRGWRLRDQIWWERSRVPPVLFLARTVWPPGFSESSVRCLVPSSHSTSPWGLT